MRQGKVRAIGASNYGPARLSAALELQPRYERLQPHYNLYERADYEANLQPGCREHGLGGIPYFSLASGSLARTYRSESDLSQTARGHGARTYLTDGGSRIPAT